MGPLGAGDEPSSGAGICAGEESDGVAAALSQQPFGRTLVGLVAVGLVAYALWLFAEATLDPERKGADAKGAATRVGSAALGCSYAALGVVAAKLALQRGGGKSSDQATRDWTARLLAHPFGVALVVAIGLSVLGAAGFFLGSFGERENIGATRGRFV